MLNRISEQNKNKQGEMMAISAYRSADDIDIIWQSDNSIQQTYYSAFRNGNVIKTTSAGVPSEWIGIEFIDRDGLEAELIEFSSEDNITMRYPNGDIISGLNLNDVANGDFGRERSVSAAEHILFSQKRKAKGIEKEREDTFQNVCYMLDRFRRCMVIRPCGFGKTVIGLKLFKQSRYQKCLFLHPQKDDLNADKVINSHINKTIDTKTYAWLRGLSKRQIKELDYDIVFMDEVHSVGGELSGKGAIKTFEAVLSLMATHPKTHFVGATATPVRMDGINVCHDIFLDHECYPYDEEEAFEDGLLKKPFYRYCVYDVIKKVRDSIDKSGTHVDFTREEIKRALNLAAEELEEIDTRYMDKYIRECCDKTIPNTEYMRFIVYYLTNEEIEANKEKVETWFKKAYPDHEIGSIVVTSRTNADLRDVDNLPTKPSSPKYKGRIDLVFNCEMLCTGYHSELITGLVMDRKTQSLAKYKQMMGRLLSCDNDTPVIIFDVVNNIHSDFVTGRETTPVISVAPAPVKAETLTYNQVVKLNPAAKNWAKIQDNNHKAEKAEKLTKIHLGKEASEPFAQKLVFNGKVINRVEELPVQAIEPSTYKLVLNGREIDSVEEIPVQTIAPEEIKSLEKELDKVYSEIHDERMSWEDAINKLAGIEDEFGTLTLEKNETIVAEEPEPSATMTQSRPTDKTEKQILSSIKEPVKENLPVFESVTSTYTKTAEEESLGYLKGHYIYDSVTGDLYSRNVHLLCKPVEDFVEKIQELNREITTAEMEYVISKWRSLSKTCEDYKSYEEVDKKSAKFKLLVSCAKMYGYGPVEPVLRYMIEKTA